MSGGLRKRPGGNNGGSKKKKKAKSFDLEALRQKYEQESLDLFRMNYPACSREVHEKKGNCVGNPNCLFGLGEKDKGIWAAVPAPIAALGPNPADQRRRPGIPAGLPNLGATCYLNALIQALYHNRELRAAVYALRPGALLEDGDGRAGVGAGGGGGAGGRRAAYELRLLFGRLQAGSSQAAATAGLVGALQLRTDEQQDPQELNTLFLDMLARVFERCGGGGGGGPDGGQGGGGGFLGGLFSGRMQYVTKCTGCGFESRSPHGFTELGVQVKGYKKLEDGLEAYSRPEEVEGYRCSSCSKVCTAQRHSEILETPRWLRLQVMRYDYDPATLTRRKLADKHAIPDRLALRGRAFALKAALYHRGASAYGGHYVAEVYSEDEAKFFEFDDSKVTPTKPKSSLQGGKISSQGQSQGEVKTGKVPPPKKSKTNHDDDEQIAIDDEEWSPSGEKTKQKTRAKKKNAKAQSNQKKISEEVVVVEDEKESSSDLKVQPHFTRITCSLVGIVKSKREARGKEGMYVCKIHFEGTAQDRTMTVSGQALTSDDERAGCKEKYLWVREGTVIGRQKNQYKVEFDESEEVEVMTEDQIRQSCPKSLLGATVAIDWKEKGVYRATVIGYNKKGKKYYIRYDPEKLEKGEANQGEEPLSVILDSLIEGTSSSISKQDSLSSVKSGERSSGDSFLLFYQRVPEEEEPAAADAAASGGGAAPGRRPPPPPPAVPADVLRAVAAENAAARAAEEAWAERRAGAEAKVEERKQLYIELFGILPSEESTPKCWIDTEWLKNWVVGYERPARVPSAEAAPAGRGGVVDLSSPGGSPGPAPAPAPPPPPPEGAEKGGAAPAPPPPPALFGAPIPLGRHACPCSSSGAAAAAAAPPPPRLPPEAVAEGRVKLVPRRVWERLRAAHGVEGGGGGDGGAPDPESQQCDVCAREYQHKRGDQLKRAAQFQELFDLLEDDEENEDEGHASNWIVSKAWVTGCKAKLAKAPDHYDDLFRKPNSSVDVTVNRAITCAHDKLVTNKKRYRYVEQATWIKIKECFPEAITYPGDTEPCQHCQDEQASTSQNRKTTRDIKAQLQAKGGKNYTNLMKRGGSRWHPSCFDNLGWLEPDKAHLFEGTRFYFWPAEWLRQWRLCVQAGNLEDIPSFPNLKADLCCQKHGGGLNVPGHIHDYLIDGNTAALENVDFNYEIVTKDQFLFLRELYDNESALTCESEEGKENRTKAPSFQYSPGQGWQWCPPLDEECVQAASRCRQHEARSFQGKAIYVRKLRPGQNPPGTAAAGAGEAGGGRPQRPRRSAGAGVEVLLNSADTLTQAKLRIMEQVDVNPSAQTLYLDGQELEGPRKTLEQLGVMAGATVYLKVGEEDPEQDILAFAAMGASPGEQHKQRTEAGFQGTLLSAIAKTQKSVKTNAVETKHEVRGAVTLIEDDPVANDAPTTIQRDEQTDIARAIALSLDDEVQTLEVTDAVQMETSGVSSSTLEDHEDLTVGASKDAHGNWRPIPLNQNADTDFETLQNNALERCPMKDLKPPQKNASEVKAASVMTDHIQSREPDSAFTLAHQDDQANEDADRETGDYFEVKERRSAEGSTVGTDEGLQSAESQDLWPRFVQRRSKRQRFSAVPVKEQSDVATKQQKVQRASQMKPSADDLALVGRRYKDEESGRIYVVGEVIWAPSMKKVVAYRHPLHGSPSTGDDDPYEICYTRQQVQTYEKCPGPSFPEHCKAKPEITSEEDHLFEKLDDSIGANHVNAWQCGADSNDHIAEASLKKAFAKASNTDIKDSHDREELEDMKEGPRGDHFSLNPTKESSNRTENKGKAASCMEPGALSSAAKPSGTDSNAQLTQQERVSSNKAQSRNARRMISELQDHNKAPLERVYQSEEEDGILCGNEKCKKLNDWNWVIQHKKCHYCNTPLQDGGTKEMEPEQAPAEVSGAAADTNPSSRRGGARLAKTAARLRLAEGEGPAEGEGEIDAHRPASPTARNKGGRKGGGGARLAKTDARLRLAEGEGPAEGGGETDAHRPASPTARNKGGRKGGGGAPAEGSLQCPEGEEGGDGARASTARESCGALMEALKGLHGHRIKRDWQLTAGPELEHFDDGRCLVIDATWGGDYGFRDTDRLLDSQQALEEYVQKRKDVQGRIIGKQTKVFSGGNRPRAAIEVSTEFENEEKTFASSPRRLAKSLWCEPECIKEHAWLREMHRMKGKKNSTHKQASTSHQFSSTEVAYRSPKQKTAQKPRAKMLGQDTIDSIPNQDIQLGLSPPGSQEEQGPPEEQSSSGSPGGSSTRKCMTCPQTQGLQKVKEGGFFLCRPCLEDQTPSAAQHLEASKRRKKGAKGASSCRRSEVSVRSAPKCTKEGEVKDILCYLV